MSHLFTLNEVAEKLRRKPLTIYRMIYAQKISAIKVGGAWMFSEEQLQQYLDSRTIKAKKLTPQ